MKKIYYSLSKTHKENAISLLVLVFSFFYTALNAQTPTASFATWKDNKRAAYTIIHDDYASYVPGIFRDADPIATARGIKLCFGAITNFCGPTEWTNARTMISHGHECVNHSHNHKCGGTAGQCSGLTTYGPADFATELGTSTTTIETNTQVRPRFFIHPYDAPSDAILTYLTNLGYLGTRAGTQDAVNNPNFTDFMRLNFFVYDGTATALSSLNTVINTAITSGSYVIREFHGIDDGSWAAMTRANYTSHLDYVKTKMDDGSIWSATATEAITYKMQRDAFQPAATYTASTATTPSFITVVFNSLQPITASLLRTPVTVNVNVTGITGNFDAFQGTTPVASTRAGNIISLNVYPHQGTVTLKCNNCTVTPPNEPVNVTNLAATPQTNAVALSWTNPTSFDEIRIVAQSLSSITGLPTSYTTTGDFTVGKIVYSDIGTSTTVTGLTPDTRYYFKAFTRLGTLWSSGVEVTTVTGSTTVITPEFDPIKCYRLTARHSSKVMEITSNSTTNGIIIQQDVWVNTLNQVWRIKNYDGTHYQISNGFSGKLVTVANSSTAERATVYQYINQNTDNQKWKFERNTEGYYFLSAKHSNKVLTINKSSIANEANVVQRTQTGATNQQWAVAEVGCPANTQALKSQSLMAFEGNLDNHKAVLRWVVKSTDLKDYYDLEKADDTHDFQRLTTVNGNSQDILRSFSYTDENLRDGDNYYRLKSIATDGSIQTSDVVKIRYFQPLNFTLSPNPASDRVDIDLSEMQGKKVEISLVTLLGKTLSHDFIESVSAPKYSMALDNIESGQYLLRIQAQGKRMVMKKLMVFR